MNKFIITSLITASMAFSASAKTMPIIPDSTGFKFTDNQIVKHTSVKDQNKTGTCWCFSTNSFFENEILRKTGKEVNLSEMFTVHHCYLDKAMKYVRMDGQINFAEGGSILDVPYVLATYGAVPEEAYTGLNYGEDKHTHVELITVLKNYMDGIKRIPGKKLTTAWYEGLKGILDAYLGKMPENFTYKGKQYTPQSFYKSLNINTNDYVAITSFTHHPFYSKFILEVADNWLWGEYNNIPMEEMKAVVDNALSKGYSVGWAADVSEGGWQWKNGYAIYPIEKTKENMDSVEYARWSKISNTDREAERYKFDGPVQEQKVTQEQRQLMFDNHQTTDDHGMIIIGTATDQNGTKYYKVKNSWNTNQIYDGYIYVSEQYFLAKTIDIYVNKEAIPTSIAKKLK